MFVADLHVTQRSFYWAMWELNCLWLGDGIVDEADGYGVVFYVPPGVGGDED